MSKLLGLVVIAIISVFAIAGCSVQGNSGSSGSSVAGTSAYDYVILAKSAVSNVPTSHVTGNIGLSPAATSFVTGFSITNGTGYATSSQVTGYIFAADMAPPTNTSLTTAVSDMITKYNTEAALPNSGPAFINVGSGSITAITLTAGVYMWTGNLAIPGGITISGSASDTFVFQIAGTLTVGSGVIITLSGGALPQNVIWVVGGATSLGGASAFKGIILDQTAITLGVGATLNGRALAQTAVTLSGTNTVVQP
jgi:hypothetical protein